LYSDFIKAFGNADQVIVLDVYAAREKKPSGFSLPDLVERIEGDHAIHIPGKNAVIDHLKEVLQPNDVLLVFSAGDAIEINEALKRDLSSKVVN
jgi:UDP-N-acetylmuramate--alanine ligase